MPRVAEEMTGNFQRVAVVPVQVETAESSSSTSSASGPWTNRAAIVVGLIALTSVVGLTVAIYLSAGSKPVCHETAGAGHGGRRVPGKLAKKGIPWMGWGQTAEKALWNFGLRAQQSGSVMEIDIRTEGCGALTEGDRQVVENFMDAFRAWDMESREEYRSLISKALRQYFFFYDAQLCLRHETDADLTRDGDEGYTCLEPVEGMNIDERFANTIYESKSESKSRRFLMVHNPQSKRLKKLFVRQRTLPSKLL